jgi:hypothetical protein
MHLALRTTLLTALAGLALAPAASAATATSDYYLARDACGGSDPANPRLDTELGAFTDGCGSLAGITGQSTTSYPSAAGALQTLDITRKVFVAISVSDFSGAGVGLGPQTIDVKLTGKDAKNKTLTLGSATDTKDAQAMLRGADYTAEFELPLKAGLAGPFKSFTLTVGVGGSQFAGFVDHDGNSFVSLPIVTTASASRVNRR